MKKLEIKEIKIVLDQLSLIAQKHNIGDGQLINALFDVTKEIDAEKLKIFFEKYGEIKSVFS